MSVSSHSNPTKPPLDLSYRHIIGIAVPVLIANLASPIQGAIDVAVVGHFEHAYNLAGLGIATQLWLLVLVSFNFLQYASSGLSAQALGRLASRDEMAHILYRSLGLAAVISLLLWLFKPFIIAYGLQFLGAPPNSAEAANDYLTVRYYGIGFELMNYAFIGWFAGQGKTKQMMMVQILVSIINIVLTLTFVYGLDMGLAGVALGTVIGYASGCATAIYLAKRSLDNYVEQNVEQNQVKSNPKTIQANQNSNSDAPSLKDQLTLKEKLADIFAIEKMKSLFSLNKDIFIRTVLLALSFAWITRMSAQQGDLVMATNAILLQVLSISAFALDGVAVAAESLSGQAAARRDRSSFELAIRRTGFMSFGLAIILSLLWAVFMPTFLAVMTDIQDVTLLALDYRYVAALLPVIGAGSYWLDGVMFGLTAGAKIRQVAVTVALFFFPLSWLAYHFYGQSGVTGGINSQAMLVIWGAVYGFLLLRFMIAGLFLWKDYRSGTLLTKG